MPQAKGVENSQMKLKTEGNGNNDYDEI